MPQGLAVRAEGRGAVTWANYRLAKPGSACERWRALGSALQRASWPVLPLPDLQDPVSHLAVPRVPVSPCLPLPPVSSIAPSVSSSPSQTQPAHRPRARDPTATPPRVPRPRVSLCHWLRQGALVTAPCQALTPPASWQCRLRRLREGTGWGRRHPPPDVGGALGWGAGQNRGVRLPAPGPGPPGARPDGLHGELGVLRGAGARAALHAPAPGESPGTAAGPGLGARGFGSRPMQTAPASGRALRGRVWGERVAGRARLT